MRYNLQPCRKIAFANGVLSFIFIYAKHCTGIFTFSETEERTKYDKNGSISSQLIDRPEFICFFRR